MNPLDLLRIARGLAPAFLAAVMAAGGGGLMAQTITDAELPQRADLWEDLFDGRSLNGWEALDKFSFKRHGEVRAEDGRLLLEAGSPATGIRFTGDPPRMGYELRLEAMRTKGHDFFCGLTFPVGESPCTLIVGGWGGGVVGLSNIDGQSAVDNETMSYRQFEENRWYEIRLRVTAERIEAWIDGKQEIDLATQDHKFSIWWEQEPAAPLGIATWYTGTALRNIQLLRLDETAEQAAEAAADDEWQSLFDGRSLGRWEESEFGGQGPVAVEDGRIVLGFTDGCTGITWKGDLPMMDYEIRLETMRVDGTDFFCGLTFPVGDDPCSLIVGGWGGAVVGLSSIDGLDAARNETTRRMAFETGRWYAVRLRVTPERIEAWIDDEQVVDLATEGRRISIRPEVEESKPLGIASWCTTAALRKIELRRLRPGEAAP